MKNQDSTTGIATIPPVLERIAQSILVAHAWVAGPAMTEQERIRRELVKAESERPRGAGITG